MANSMEKIISLVKRTGDRCVVVDVEGNPLYVVLSFAEYEKLISGSENLAALNEDEMLDKINRDVASWRSNQQEQQLRDWDSVESAIQEAKVTQGASSAVNLKNSLNKEDNKQKKDQYYFEPIE